MLKKMANQKLKDFVQEEHLINLFTYHFTTNNNSIEYLVL